MRGQLLVRSWLGLSAAWKQFRRLRPQPHAAPAVRFLTAVSAAWLGIATPLSAQPPKPALSLTVEQAAAELTRVQARIKALRESPDAPQGWHELEFTERTIDYVRRQRDAELDDLQRTVYGFKQQPKLKEWYERIEQLERQQDALERVQWRHQREVGLHVFQARHEQLASQADVPVTELKALGLTLLNFPSIDGSTSTQPLAVLIACRAFGAPYAWVGEGMFTPQYRRDEPSGFELLVFGKRKREPEAELLEFSLQARMDTSETERLGTVINYMLAANASTHDAYVNLIEGKRDLGLLARGPSKLETEMAKQKNVELDVTPCALDAFVFMVNENNAVRNLTTGQIQDIYSGFITNWSKVGGSDREIEAFQRDEQSGSQQLMKSLVMKGIPLYEPTEKYRTTPNLVGRIMSSPFLALSRSKDGIGYSVYYYERFMSGSPNTRVIAVDGVEPNPTTISQRTYPFVSEVFVVTRRSVAPDSPTAKLRGWLLSPEGQAVVRSSGYVPIN